MSKVPNKSHLIPTKKIIHNPKGSYSAIRWINPEETKKRVKQYISEREKGSFITRYMKKHPTGVHAYTEKDLEQSIQPNKNGERYYTGQQVEGSRKVSMNIKLIKWVFEFEEPVKGVLSTIIKKDGESSRQYLTAKREKNTKEKFSRCKNIGKQLDNHRERYNKMMKAKSVEKIELGAVLGLLDKYQMRIGGSAGEIEEQKIKEIDLKPGMVITHGNWGPKSIPQQVVWNDGKTKLMLRNMQTKVDSAIPPKLTEFTRLGHYGASNLEVRHIKIDGGKVFLDIIGKSGVWQQFEITDPQIASSLKELHKGKAPTDRMFPNVKRSKVVRILDKLKVRPHDFRSYHATKTFVEEQANFPTPTTKKELRQIEKSILEKCSMKLWNKPGTCKSAYVDPSVYVTWRTGLLKNITERKMKKALLVIASRPLDEGRDRDVLIMSLNEYKEELNG